MALGVAGFVVLAGVVTHFALPPYLEGRVEVCPDLREALESALVHDPPLSAREGNIIRRGYNAELETRKASGP